MNTGWIFSDDTADDSGSPEFPSPGAQSTPPFSVVSARNRAAKATFTASPLGLDCNSAPFHPRRFSSSTMIRSALANASSGPFYEKVLQNSPVEDLFIIRRDTMRGIVQRYFANQKRRLAKARRERANYAT